MVRIDSMTTEEVIRSGQAQKGSEEEDHEEEEDSEEEEVTRRLDLARPRGLVGLVPINPRMLSGR